uniref:Cell division cycle associated 2 n=1 Tax=Astyanax mexicanus TaxID=7994 RepID=W5L6Q1_ASTMX
MDSVETVGSRTPLGVLTPSQQNSEAGDADFSKLTPSHFGISTDSFITFKEKDKSRVGQLKSRRRSTIGVRGSPETNSLIRFRAKEVLKTPPRTPQQMLENPLFSGCDSIKQKMAAFQRLMGEDEEDGEESVAPETEEKKNERVGGDSTGDAQNGSGSGSDSEETGNRLTPVSHRPAVTPPPSKRRRRVPSGFCTEEIQEEPVPDLQNILKQEVICSQFKSPAPVLVLGSDSQSQLMSLPMLSKPEVMRTDDPEVSSVSKKKRVRFGAPLSPEFFDKTLPPSTPLQKGATPLRPPSSTGRKHSLLKTPQRFEPLLPQPDFYSPKDNGASPEFRIPRSRRDEEEDGDEVFLYGEKISFPVLEEESDPPADHRTDTVLAEGPHPVLHPPSPAAGSEYMDTAFQEEVEPLDPTLSAEPESSLEPQQNPEDQQRPESPASTAEASRPRGRKRKQQAERESEPETKRSSHKPKTKQIIPEKEKEDEDEPETRRSSRSAAASAKGKLKTASAKRRFGSKEVDRSLYGKRDYASKNPLLSPIIETTPASLPNTPTPPSLPHTGVNSAPDSNSTNQTTSIPNASSGASDGSDRTAGLVAAAALFRRRFLQPPTATQPQTNNESTTAVDDSSSQSEADLASDDTLCQMGVAQSGAKAPKARRNSGRPAGRRRSANSARARRLSGSAQEHETNDLEEPEEPASIRSSGSESSESLEASETQTSEQIETQNQINEFASTAKTSDETQPKTTTYEKAEDEPCQDPLETNQSPEELTEDPKHPTEPSEPVLEAWQEADFNIEDVLKPVKTKSRGSVRRSLRNRRSVQDVQASGLAWVDHTSPELMTAGRRRTRSRLSAVYQPATVLDTEEPQQQQNLGE